MIPTIRKCPKYMTALMVNKGEDRNSGHLVPSKSLSGLDYAL